MNLTAGLYVDIMAVGDFMSFDQNSYVNQYKRDNYDRVSILVPKGTKEIWKNYATLHGLTLAELLRRAMDQYMEK